jgi:Peptidase family C78
MLNKDLYQDTLVKRIEQKLILLKIHEKIQTANLCSINTLLFSNGDRDNWSCGYRNCLMLLSSLGSPYKHLVPVNPNIAFLQQTLESAWMNGFDPEGGEHYGFKIRGKCEWIGTTEIATLLGFLGIKAKIYDFVRPTGPDGTHPLLIDVVDQYFSSGDGIISDKPRYLYLTQSVPPTPRPQPHNCRNY